MAQQQTTAASERVKRPTGPVTRHPRGCACCCAFSGRWGVFAYAGVDRCLHCCAWVMHLFPAEPEEQVHPATDRAARGMESLY